MKLVIQRVKQAKVTDIEKGDVTGEIKNGLFVLVGFKKGDTEKTADFLAQKLIKLRVMSDANDKMNLSASDAGGEFLIVSQFTLYADTTGGNRPSFIDTEEPDKAEKLYEYFVGKMRQSGINVATGRFGSYMNIETVLDGPVTIVLEN